jgi:hypothetical protein
MTRLTALLPVAQGVAVIAALGRDADTNIAMNRPGKSGESFRWKDLCYGAPLEVSA